MIHFNGSLRGEKKGTHKNAWVSGSCLIFQEWENGVLYVEAAALPAREANLDTLLMEAFALM